MKKLYRDSVNHIGRSWIACGIAAVLLSFPLADYPLAIAERSKLALKS